MVNYFLLVFTGGIAVIRLFDGLMMLRDWRIHRQLAAVVMFGVMGKSSAIAAARILGEMRMCYNFAASACRLLFFSVAL
jgi:hypothetical protein